jgi:mono/diheme cytochrome c family protein
MVDRQTGQKCWAAQVVFAFIVLLISEASIAEDVEAGRALFRSMCASCHGEDGDGNGPAAEQLVLKPRDFALAAFKFDTDANWVRGADEDLANVIRNGAAAYGGSAMMAPWTQLSEQEVKDLIRYIRSLE